MVTYKMPQWQLQNAYKSFGTNEKEVNEMVGKLKSWLSDQPHLPQNLEEEILLLFALGCGKGIEDCSKRLDVYFSMRLYMPHFFASRDPLTSKMLTTNNTIGCGFMNGLTPENYKVFVLKILNTDPTNFYIAETITWFFMGFDVVTRKEVFSGLCSVIDCSGMTFGHYVKCNPSLVRDSVYCIQNVYPIKVKMILFMNSSWFMKLFYNNVIRPVLKRKIADRVHFLDSQDDLNKHLPSDMIPSDMSGKGLSVNEVSEMWNNEIRAERDWLMNEGSQTSNESKRIGKSPFSAPGCVLM